MKLNLQLYQIEDCARILSVEFCPPDWQDLVSLSPANKRAELVRRLEELADILAPSIRNSPDVQKKLVPDAK